MVTETAISGCARLFMCVWRALNQGPRVQSFVARENDSSRLIQTRFVGEMSQCRITSVCSFEMFGVIKKKKSGFCGEFCVNTVIRDACRCRLPQGMEVSLKIATVYHLQCDATVRSALGPRQVCSERRIHAHSSLVPPDDTISFVTTVIEAR